MTIRGAAICVALVTAIFMAAIIYFGELWLPPFVALGVVGVGAVYYLAEYILESYVAQKIRPIYQIIHQLGHVSSAQIRKHYKGKDISVGFEGQVKQWAERSRSEIENLKVLEQYRKEFVGNVSHELKTPLFSLQGYVETLLRGGVDDPAISRPYLEKSDRNIQRLINIVNDLEDISRLESGTLVLYKTHFDLVLLAREVIESLDTRNIVRLESPKPSEMVYADRARIEQVLVNLISNAIKYGTQDDTALVTVRFLDLFEKVLVEVQDNGVGISSDNMPRLFERFYRIDKTRSRESGGTGLGLAIVKHIVEAHQETITVRSAPAEGSTFSFTLSK